MSSSTTNKAVMRIYAAGGCGVNVVSNFNGLNAGAAQTSYAETQLAYIDTSMADIAGRQIDPSKVYHIEGLDGQGSLRGMDLDKIQQHIPSVLLNHEPGDINIVVHSTAGGTGSVVGPLIVQRLLESGHSVIPCVVSSTASTIQSKNTLNTIRSYANICEAVGRPLAMSWHSNQDGRTQKDIDGDVRFMIALLSVVYSGNNAKLDGADLKNWLDYTKVTDYPAELCALRLHSGTGAFTDAVSVCSLLSSTQEPPANMEVPYHTYGFMPEDVAQTIHHKGRPGPVSIGLVLNTFDTLVKKLEADVSKGVQRAGAHRSSTLGTGTGRLVL